MNINWKFIVKVVGYVLILESLFLCLSAAVAYYFRGTDMQALAYSAAITLATGAVMVFSTGFYQKTNIIGKRESYIGVASCWITFALFGALPFYWSGLFSGFTDTFFESMAGITATGASIIPDIDAIPKGLLFWRSVMQWLGGIGIVVFSVALLPLLGGGAAHLFDAESTGLSHDKFRPRVNQMAKRLAGMYLLLTALVIVLLGVGPMDWYDAVCHGLTTISTGGFSTRKAGIAYWDSLYIESVQILFMLLGSINFTLLYLFLFRGNAKKFFKDEELRWFFSVIGISFIIIGAGLYLQQDGSVAHSFRQSLFQVVSAITTTGFSTYDYSLWGHAYIILLLFLMVFCGCAGSTSGGLKIVRGVVLAKNTANEFSRLIHPRAIIPVRLNGAALSFEVVQRLLAFIFLYIGIILVSWGILILSGIPFLEALGASVSMIGNVGLGFGDLSASYAGVPTVAKWYMAFLMVVGRLEIFTILILFSPGFWKR
ncbi:MAG: TrkH family potassium uptake protein [Dysgonamonadaceae bacterium]|jgi:trk system potassium uptake protein TrkH|nr:TrkH family potassium uptake protein [Dysgonamonadaceae bacterium]